jgi:hypothetical protein
MHSQQRHIRDSAGTKGAIKPPPTPRVVKMNIIGTSRKWQDDKIGRKPFLCFEPERELGSPFREQGLTILRV